MKKIRKLADKKGQSISMYVIDPKCVEACLASGYTCADCSQCMGSTALMQTRRDSASSAVNDAYVSQRSLLNT